MKPIELIAQPTRMEILRLIWNRERTAGEIAGEFDLTFGAISQHLRALEEAGLVEARREWRRRFYRARPEALGSLAAYLEGLWAGRSRASKRSVRRPSTNQWPAGWK